MSKEIQISNEKRIYNSGNNETVEYPEFGTLSFELDLNFAI